MELQELCLIEVEAGHSFWYADLSEGLFSDIDEAAEAAKRIFLPDVKWRVVAFTRNYSVTKEELAKTGTGAFINVVRAVEEEGD